VRNGFFLSTSLRFNGSIFFSSVLQTGKYSGEYPYLHHIHIFTDEKIPVQKWHNRKTCLQNTSAAVAQPLPHLQCTCATVAQLFCNRVLWLCRCCTGGLQACFAVVPLLHRWFAGMFCSCAGIAQVVCRRVLRLCRFCTHIFHFEKGKMPHLHSPKYIIRDYNQYRVKRV
jgi:hypothetical protein